MRPRRPHVQRAPSISWTMCPISPAPPRPVHGRPSRISPPPTPVPQKTPRSDPYSRPAPSRNSASVATCTSLPMRTSVPRSSPSLAASGKVPSQSGRLRALVTSPSAIVPGEPTPTAARTAGSSSAALPASRSAWAISAATSAGPPSVGVGRRADPSTLFSSSTIAAWIFVPPRSIPPYVGIALIIADPAPPGGGGDCREAAGFSPAYGLSSPALTAVAHDRDDSHDQSHKSILARVRTGGSMYRCDHRRLPHRRPAVAVSDAADPDRHRRAGRGAVHGERQRQHPGSDAAQSRLQDGRRGAADLRDQRRARDGRTAARGTEPAERRSDA